MKWLKPIVFFVIASGLFYALSFPRGSVPPPGKLFNPFAGFWRNNTAGDEILSHRELAALQEDVEIVWDDRRVPHVFARNLHDLYFSQGYLVARDRLWQMEFQTHAAAGRLAEIVGPRALEFDRHRRRLGMVYAAENAAGAMAAHPEIRLAVEAYTAGVNAWIDQLSPATLPLEYKILDYEPEPWTTLKSALLLKQMALTLSGRSQDRLMTATRAALGEEAMKQLFPNYPPLQDPIVPANTEWDFVPLITARPPRDFKPGMAQSADDDLPRQDEAGQIFAGSNNWAVAGSKTASGYPILCNDPHLALTLPSIWYEIQLHAPGINVYGVTLMGAPGVIIGFNENVAWGVTNAESDALDWYDIKFRDESRNEYFYDGRWRRTSPRLEVIKVRGGATVRDTVIYTHHGPVPYRKGEKPFDEETPPGAALRWAAHDSSHELLTFYRLNRAAGYQDFLDALSYYDCPAQNFVYADRENHIAIRHNGKFPVRWFEQGKYIADGSDPAHEWRAFIPKEQLPAMHNPERGFVSSANQNPVDEKYPYYLGWNYAAFERGRRINEFLAGHDHLTPQDMMALQGDVVSLRAKTVLPRLLELLHEERLSAVQKQIRADLKAWDYGYRADSRAAIVFNTWWRELMDAIWKDDMKKNGLELKIPRSDVTIDLILHQPESAYYDLQSTAMRESLAEVTFMSFQNAHQKLTAQLGEYGEAWAWRRARGTNIEHVARVPGLGRMKLPTSGNFDNVNAITHSHGPSWRMIVALGPEIKAWGIYPGGQSGNPGSDFYEEAVEKWVAGEYFELLFLKNAQAAAARLRGRTLLRGGK